MIFKINESTMKVQILNMHVNAEHMEVLHMVQVDFKNEGLSVLS